MPSDVEDSLPWKLSKLIAGKFLQNYDYDSFPLRFESNILIEMDLELPGFPIMRIGILLMRQIRVEKRFYIKALL
jgi:hypothetical protein